MSLKRCRLLLCGQQLLAPGKGQLGATWWISYFRWLANDGRETSSLNHPLTLVKKESRGLGLRIE